MAAIIEWIKAEGAGHCFFQMFPVALLAMFIWFKGKRIRFLLPSLLMTLVIVNPWFYQKWDSMGLYAYWRVLWVIPVIPVLAAFIPSITERVFAGTMTAEKEGAQPKKAIGMVLVAVGIAVVIVSGTYVYHTERGIFTRADNSAKIPDDIVAVADRLLELDEQPRIVTDSEVSLYIREYSGQIDTLYGRDIYGYILRSGSTAQNVSAAVSEGDWDTVGQEMVDDDFDYLVTKNEAVEGFELVDQVGQYGIYRAVGKPSVIKERNELGQVIRVTTVDEDGNPVNGKKNYSTTLYEYDENGRVSREFHTDAEGEAVADLQGVAGYEKEYDDQSHVIMQRFLGTDGKPVAGSAGYVEVRRIYEDSNLVRESYYDESGEPVNRIDTWYAAVKLEYDESDNMILKEYFDTTGEAVRASSGYAAVRRKYEQGQMTEEAYFDENGTAVTVKNGYAGKKRAYDDFGNITVESYFDVSGMPTECINGYARVEREYNGENNMVMQRYLDSEGHLVVTGAGYAEVRRMYQGEHLTREAYYGADGEPMMKPAGYCAIEQVWNEDDLYIRMYLGPDGFPVNRTDGYARAVWEPGDTCTNIKFYDVNGTEISPEGLNLAKDVRSGEDGWSNWMTPGFNVLNSTQNIGYVNLGQKEEGDVYTCQVEIEFKGVTATEGQDFRFASQGAQDGKWGIGNVWNGKLVSLTEAPEDGVYTYTVTNKVSESMVDISTFNIGFRCDYWASGSFRVRSVKIEKGKETGEWSQGV